MRTILRAGEGAHTRFLYFRKSGVRFISELQLERELDLTRGRGGRCNDPARGAVLGALEKNLIRVREIRVIQNIERLGAELQIHSLTDSHSLQQRGVDHEQARTAERSASHVPEGPLERQHEGSRIEPLIGFPQNQLPLKVRIPVRYFGNTWVAGSSRIRAGQWREGESTCNSDAPIP